MDKFRKTVLPHRPMLRQLMALEPIQHTAQEQRQELPAQEQRQELPAQEQRQELPAQRAQLQEQRAQRILQAPALPGQPLEPPVRAHMIEVRTPRAARICWTA
jgi:hypothetical protein